MYESVSAKEEASRGDNCVALLRTAVKRGGADRHVAGRPSQCLVRCLSAWGGGTCMALLGMGWEKPPWGNPGRGGLLEGVGSMQLTSLEHSLDWGGDFIRLSLVFCR